jgi:hypothetical protein
MGPEKTQILAQNSLVLILPKISRLGQKQTKTLFFYRDFYIADRLYIMVTYVSFKKIKFSLKIQSC